MTPYDVAGSEEVQRLLKDARARLDSLSPPSRSQQHIHSSVGSSSAQQLFTSSISTPQLCPVCHGAGTLASREVLPIELNLGETTLKTPLLASSTGEDGLESSLSHERVGRVTCAACGGGGTVTRSSTGSEVVGKATTRASRKSRSSSAPQTPAGTPTPSSSSIVEVTLSL